MQSENLLTPFMWRQISLALGASLVAGLFLSSAAGFAAEPGAKAASWPTKPVKIIVPYPAGGVVDIQTRAVTIRMAQDTGQSFIVEPKPGANGNIGAEAVATAPADGHTLLVTAPYFINNPMIEKDLRWKPADFVPAVRFALSPSYFMVPISLPVNSVAEYFAYAKSRSGLQYADPGTGTTQSMAMLMLQAVAGIKLEPIPYKGAVPVVPDLITGMVTMSVLPSTVGLPPYRDGKLKLLATMADKRSPTLPDVPTIAEAGYGDATVLSWYGLHAPAKTPPEIIARISEVVGAAAATSEVDERLKVAGGERAYLPTDAFIDFLKADQQRWIKFKAMTEAQK